jgi:hypothetical protein
MSLKPKRKNLAKNSIPRNIIFQMSSKIKIFFISINVLVEKERQTAHYEYQEQYVTSQKFFKGQ